MRQHGHYFPVARNHGEPEGCDNAYKNSYLLSVKRPDLLYTEGYVFVGGQLLPSAWCVDASGAAIDVTFDLPDAHYFGIPMRADYVERNMKIGEVCASLLMGKDRGLSFLMGHVKAADFVADWPGQSGQDRPTA